MSSFRAAAEENAGPPGFCRGAGGQDARWGALGIGGAIRDRGYARRDVRTAESSWPSGTGIAVEARLQGKRTRMPIYKRDTRPLRGVTGQAPFVSTENPKLES